MDIPDKKLCEERVAKYKNDPQCIQAYEYYKEWLEYYNSGNAPIMIPSSSMEILEEETLQYKILTNESIKKILTFSPYFLSNNNFGEWKGSENKDRINTIPHLIYADKVSEFIEVLHSTNFIISFNWSKWDEGKKIISDVKLIKVVDLLTLRKLITAIVRNDRFCEGTLLNAIEDGIIQIVLKRLQQLLNKLS